MSTDQSDPEHPEPVALADFRTEIQASFAVNTLREAGIRCEMVGGASAGFRAESPGYVRLLVAAADAERARLLIADMVGDDAGSADEGDEG
ncbi:MAG: DUF2007 domain-containing protein [Planctomycetota bacterium]